MNPQLPHRPGSGLKRGYKRKADIGLGLLIAEISQENGHDHNEILENHDHSNDAYENWRPVKLSSSIYMEIYCRVANSLREIITADGLTRPTENMDDSKTIFQFGCTGFPMHDHLRQLPGVGRLVYLGNDETKLKKNTKKLCAPVRKRETPLRVQVYAGRITELDPNRMDSQQSHIFALLALQAVEFLDRDELNAFVRNVFGVTSPSVVIITTPNSETNVFFTLLPGRLRHKNHKFEWSRQEFDLWCHHVCKQYPSYSFTTEGIGEGQPGTEDRGCVFQMAIFRKSELAEDFDCEYDERMGESAYNESKIFEGLDEEKCYKLVYDVVYPHHYDPTPLDEKIVKEFQSYTEVNLLPPLKIQEYIQDEILEIKLALDIVNTLPRIPTGTTVDEIRCALRGANYRIVDEEEDRGRVTYIFLPVPQTWDDDSRDDEYNRESESESESEGILNSSVENIEEEVW